MVCATVASKPDRRVRPCDVIRLALTRKLRHVALLASCHVCSADAIVCLQWTSLDVLVRPDAAPSVGAAAPTFFLLLCLLSCFLKRVDVRTVQFAHRPRGTESKSRHWGPDDD